MEAIAIRPERSRAPAPDPGPRLPPAGVGFKHAHAEAIADDAGLTGFLEVHAENYMGAGGPPHRLLERARRDHPLSLHGVAMSIGGTEPLRLDHLERFAALVRRYEPFLVSEHLAWSTQGHAYYNDLLPLPYTRATLDRVCDHVDQVQAAIGCPLLLENPATYVAFEASEMAEAAFVGEVARRTGCRLLLDLNNVLVGAVNHGRSATADVDAFPLDRVDQIHLAGHTVRQDAAGRPLLIDSHDGAVSDAVWSLFERVLARGCRAPVLVEWDGRVPDWSVLRAEAEAAHACMQRVLLATEPARV